MNKTKQKKRPFFARWSLKSRDFMDRCHGLNYLQGFNNSLRPCHLHYGRRTQHLALRAIFKRNIITAKGWRNQGTAYFYFSSKSRSFHFGLRKASKEHFTQVKAVWTLRRWKGRRFQENKNQPSVFCFVFWAMQKMNRRWIWDINFYLFFNTHNFWDWPTITGRKVGRFKVQGLRFKV